MSRRAHLLGYLFSVGMASGLIFSANPYHYDANPDQLQVQRVAPSPEPDFVILTMPYPEQGQVLSSGDVYFSLKIEGYPLGTNSTFLRGNEVVNSPLGQTIHIIVDDLPYFAKGREVINTLDQSDNYYLDDIVVELPENLSAGEHLLRVFPARSYGESLKDEGCFVMRSFYVKNKSKKLPYDLSAPLLTYNEPQGEYPFRKGRPILLDFYITNCDLSKDGFKVKLTIDKTMTRTISEWTPYYIYGLDKGTHTIELELLDPQNRRAVADYNYIKRSFSIK